MEIFCNIINVFAVTFDQFNASSLDNSINSLKTNLTDTFEWQCNSLYVDSEV